MAHTLQELADLIFPQVSETVADLEARYPRRQLPEGAMVTRFAPSPTGFLHTGSLFTALVAYTVAKRTGGVYFFRLEDTDQKREVAGTGDQLVDQTDNGRWFDADRFGDHAWADTITETADGDDRPCNGLGQPETGSKPVANRRVGTRDLCHGNHQFHKRAIVSGHSMFTF